MTNIIKVKFNKDGKPQGREYTYFSPIPVGVGDMVEIETKGKAAKGTVTQTGVPESEISAFKDKIKTILGKVKTETTIEEAKEIIESLLPLQDDFEKGAIPCPRCGRYTMDYPAVKNALSRRANIYICSDCGMEEAMLDAAGMEPLPLNKWAKILRIK